MTLIIALFKKKCTLVAAGILTSYLSFPVNKMDNIFIYLSFPVDKMNDIVTCNDNLYWRVQSEPIIESTRLRQTNLELCLSGICSRGCFAVGMCETSSFIAKEYFVRGLGAKSVLSSSQILLNLQMLQNFTFIRLVLVNRFVIAQVRSVFIKKA